MGRPRKPTAQLEASGAFRKDPQRSRPHEPKAEGPIGEPPGYFDAAHRALWAEIADECPKGVLAKSDRKLLELAVRLTAKMRNVPGRMPKWLAALGELSIGLGMDEDDVERMKQAIHAALGVSSQELTLLATTLTRMGMTPADRSRVHVEPDKPAADPFAEIDAALAGSDHPETLQ